MALWLVRRPLARMLDRVNPTKVDVWGFKAEFEKRLDKVDLLIAELDEPDRSEPSAAE